MLYSSSYPLPSPSLPPYPPQTSPPSPSSSLLLLFLLLDTVNAFYNRVLTLTRSIPVDRAHF